MHRVLFLLFVLACVPFAHAVIDTASLSLLDDTQALKSFVQKAVHLATILGLAGVALSFGSRWNLAHLLMIVGILGVAIGLCEDITNLAQLGPKWEKDAYDGSMRAGLVILFWTRIAKKPVGLLKG